MKFWAVLFLGLAGFSLSAADSRSLSIDEAVGIGLKNATSVLKAQNDTENSGAVLLQSYGQFLPNLVGTASYNYLSGKTFLTTGPPTVVNSRNYGANLQLGTTLNLFNGLSDLAGLKSAIERNHAAEWSFYRAKQQIVIDITQAFLQVVLDKSLVDIATKNLAASVERQRLLQEQTRVGVRNLADLYRQEAQTSADESFLVNSQVREREDLLSLIRRLRIDINAKYEIVAPPLEAPQLSAEQLQPDALLKTARESRTDLKAAQSTYDSASWGVTQARAGYLPRLDLGFNVYSNSRWFTQNIYAGANAIPSPQEPMGSQLGDHTYYVVGLTLTWNLFDRFQTNENLTAARVNENNAQLDFDDRRRQVDSDIRQVIVDYQGQVQQLESSKKGLVAAEQAYQTVEGRYQVGAASFVDLVTAQSALVQAQSNRIQAQIGLALQRKLYDFYQGTLPVAAQ